MTILRPTLIYGNTSDDIVARFIKVVGKLPIMPAVNGARYELQPVHYMDLSEAYYQDIMNEETTVNNDFSLSGGEKTEFRTMLEVIGERLGKRAHFLVFHFRLLMLGLGLFMLLRQRKRIIEKKCRGCVSQGYIHTKRPQQRFDIIQGHFVRVSSLKRKNIRNRGIDSVRCITCEI